MAELSVYINNTTIKEIAPNEFIFFEANALSLPIYFALKSKHDYVLTNRDEFEAYLQDQIKKLSIHFDTIIIPESRHSFLTNICSYIENIGVLSKNSKEHICENFLKSQKWSKDEIKSAQAHWRDMPGGFEINKIKSNKRQFYEQFLFEKKRVEGRVLLLDDFKRSGSTMRAMTNALQGCFEISRCAVFSEMTSS